MNLFHRWYCGTARWAKSVQEQGLPRLLDGVELGDDVLEIGPGPGVTTDWLRTRIPRLTAIEIDEKLARSLRERMEGTNVTVVEGDGTRMSFPDASFSGAISLTMLHHVPTAELQDQLFAEARRVLRPGGVFTGFDSTPNFIFNLFHLFDTCVPVDPETLPQRLEAAGFVDVTSFTFPGGFSFRAHAPSVDTAPGSP